MLEPIYVLGSTGSRKPTLDLMAAVSQLSNGHIILPGFDFDAPSINVVASIIGPRNRGSSTISPSESRRNMWRRADKGFKLGKRAY